jgi:hypothetical protein
MADGQNQDDVFRGQPAIFGDVALAAAGKDQLASPFLGFATQGGNPRAVL